MATLDPLNDTLKTPKLWLWCSPKPYSEDAKTMTLGRSLLALFSFCFFFFFLLHWLFFQSLLPSQVPNWIFTSFLTTMLLIPRIFFSRTLWIKSSAGQLWFWSLFLPSLKFQIEFSVCQLCFWSPSSWVLNWILSWLPTMLLIPLTFSSSKLSSQQAEYAFEEQLEF